MTILVLSLYHKPLLWDDAIYNSVKGNFFQGDEQWSISVYIS